MKTVVALCALCVGLLVSGRSQAAIAEFIIEHPKVAYSIQWEVERYVGPGYFANGLGKVNYYDWSPEQQEALEVAYEEALAWYESGDPYQQLDENIQYPPENLDDTSIDTDAPYTTVSEAYAWDLYLRWVAWTLLAEVEGHFPWSILEYDTEALKVLLDSNAMFARVGSDRYQIATGSPTHPNFVRRAGNRGETLIGPPRYTYAFLHNAGLIGSSRHETIVNLLDWGSENLTHFFGASSYGNYEAHWQYRGSPPLSAVIEGTVRDTESEPRHWTAGCQGTSGFLRNVLRAANIPVQIANRCGHGQPYFMTEGLFLDHADNIYNSTFTGLGISAEALLIDRETHAAWFGDNPDNHEDYCGAAEAIARQVDVLAGTVEICGDGLDNDGDGNFECDDSDCASTSSTQPKKFIASDADSGMCFGNSIALSGDSLLVGTHASDSEAAYLYRKGPSGWVEDARLVPPTFDGLLAFGTSVALEGDAAFVQSTDLGFESWVHVFSRSGAAWTEEQVLRASDQAPQDFFGTAMALDGATLVIGAPGLSTDVPGAAYVFIKDGSGAWQEQEKLTPTPNVVGFSFGAAVAIEGDTIVVGAPYATLGPLAQTGAAHVFRATGNGWSQEAVLLAPQPDVVDWFGSAVAISGGRVLVGSPSEQVEGFGDAGAVHVFDHDAQTGSWSASQRLVSPNAQEFSGFGADVAFAGSRVAVGARLEEASLGAAYLFEHDGSSFDLLDTLVAPEGLLGDSFGSAVGLDGELIAVSAQGHPSQGPATGAVYLFSSESTQAGQCVDVSAQATGDPNVTLQFSSVQSSGTTHVESSTSGPALPSGFQIGSPPTYYDITTTTSYEGVVRVCIDYSDVSYQNESALTLLHYQDGMWLDLCEDPARCELDTGSNVLCAYTDSLSPFALAQAPVADLSIAQTIVRSQDGRVIIGVTVTNLGPDSATSVLVTDSLPSGINYVSCAATAGGDCFQAGDGSVTVAFDALGAGQSATITIVGCTVSGSGFTNVAAVAGDERDPNQANNTVTKQLPAPNSLPAVQLANGDMRYAVTFSQTQAYVEAFVRKNGVQSPTGNIVSSKINNADGTFTYYRVVPKSQYGNGDVINVRFYSYRSGQPGVFTPGPVEWVSYPDFVYGSGSTTCQTGCRPTYKQLPNGDVKTAYTFTTPRNYVEAFVRKNGTQVAAGNIVQSGVANFDGTFSYSRITPASLFTSGSQVTFRFYSTVPSGPQVFTPGPTANNWFPGFTYNGNPSSNCQ